MSTADDLVVGYLTGRDVSPNTARALRADLRKFAHWFQTANGEHLDPARVTVRDVADFRDHLHTVRRQAVASTNRCLVSIRRVFSHLVTAGLIRENPAQPVNEIRRMPTTPKGLKPADVRRVLREAEVRADVRASAVFGMMLFGGLRVSDVVGCELSDLELSARSGHVVCRHGKGNKQRIVPLPLEARRALSRYLESRPPADTNAVFVGERGRLTDDGVRGICAKYSALSGVFFSPHTLRHTFAHRFLDQGGDLASLAQILGHESLNTTAIYTRRSDEELARMTEELRYE